MPQPVQAPADVTTADFVIGIAAGFDPRSTPAITQALQALPGALHIVVLQDVAPVVTEPPEPPSPAGTSVSSMTWPTSGTDASSSPLQSLLSAYRAIFSISQKLNSRGCAVVASHIEDLKPGWVSDLVRPLVESDFDMVVPSYARRKLEGLLNSSIISPLTRC